jgi:CRISPR-associated endoribonuclease Cas6
MAQSFTGGVSTLDRLYALLLKVRPLGRGTLMPFSGQLVQGAWFSWVRSIAPQMVEHLHAWNQRRPYTCSNLQFPLPEARIREAERENRHLLLDPEKVYTVRITLLAGQLYPIIYEALLQSRTVDSAAQPFMRLGEQSFLLETVLSSADDSTGWAGFTSYGGLAERVEGLVFPRDVPLELEFASLTAFHWTHPEDKRYGSYCACLPLPHYIFPFLARRWQELAPPDLVGLVQKERIEDYIRAEGVIIDDYSLRAHQVHFPRFSQRGFVGSCRYLLRGPDDGWPTQQAPLTVRQQIYLLARFAYYAGVGYKTTMGMGQVRPVAP